MSDSAHKASPRRHARGFKRASSFMETRVRKATEGRGFSDTRVLTHWEEIVGPETARMARPVKVHYGRQGFGATLTLLTIGAQAPMLEMQKDKIREKVNACYGYAAISTIRITQTAATGFADGQVAFTPAPKASPPLVPDADASKEARSAASRISDPKLRKVLEDLGSKVLSRGKQR